MTKDSSIPLIDLQNVSKKYVIGDAEYLVLNKICLQIYSGDMIAILGRSGSGKSTLMNLIGLLDQADSGNYFLSGKNITGLNDLGLAQLRNESIGFVFQNFNLLPRLTALENIALPLLYRNISQHTALQRAQEMLNSVEMSDLATHMPAQLSGGEQQRVAIARALIGSPLVILADEPTGALDATTSKIIMNLFHGLHQAGKTLVFVTHDQRVADQCQKQWSLIDGHIQNSEKKA